MNAQDCLQILRQIKDVAFATVDENGLPQVRIIDVMLVEQGRLYFCTARGKDFFRQMEANGQAAVTGMNEKYQMVRLTGRAHRLSEQKQWIDRIFEQNPSMNAVYPGDSRYILEPFCIDNGQIEFFDLGTEPMMRNITVEYLFLLLNERMEAGLSTMVTTNLTPAQIQERYGERVCSRLFDRLSALTIKLEGKDLRLHGIR